MGVPAFYRWLRDKYTKCIVNVVEEEVQEVDGVQVPINYTAANPNGVEFDNLYLDMNGIIHPCVHPEDIPPPETEEDMFLAIFAYIDRLMRAVRPRKLLFMAIDGVAPRAKMNQQRARRFKAAQEIKEREEVEEEMRARLLARGQKAPPKGSKGGTFDHNVITPGTTFMDRLAFFLRYYIHDRMNSEPGWRDIRVILSDASVPGEGEHKVMEFIRQQRAVPGYCPNTRHILHGLDADLIMLGLATHEPHFTILREEVLPPRSNATAPNACFVCGQPGHKAQDCPKKEKGKAGGKGDTSHYKPLQFLHLNILREYLHLEFSQLATAPSAPWPMPYDLDRVVDDFVFICFFVGNDFLPHLPSLDIREGAIDLLMALYKALLPAELGGYITHAGHVHTGRAAVLLSKVGKLEDEIFKRRKRVEDRQKQQEMGRKAQEAAAEKAALVSAALDPTRVGSQKEQVAALVADWKAQALPPSAVVGVGRSRPEEEGGAGLPPAKRAHLGEGQGQGAGNKDAAAALRANLLGHAKPAAPVIQGPPLPETFVAALSPSELSQARSAQTGHCTLLLEDDTGLARAQGEGEREGKLKGDEGQDVGMAVASATQGEDPALLPPAPGPAIVQPSPLPQPTASPVSLALDEDGEAPPGMEGDPTLPAQGMDAEALAQLVEDEGGGSELAATVKELLKESVTAALASKHTHEDVVDTVALGVPGWRERYYAQKFGKHAVEDVHFVRTVCCDYASGLVWVYKYYLQGVASWKWFYPHHYAPFAADLAQAMSDMHKGSTVKPLSLPGVGGSAAGAVMSSASVTFELGKPFRPLDQLMGVLPSLSAHALPKACHALMTDPASPVYDFYPTSFAQDPNGKKFSWLWVVLLPFIDEGRLVAAMDSVAHCFTGDERRRNTLGNELLFVHGDTPMGRLLSPMAPTAEEVRALSTWQPPAIGQGEASAGPAVDTAEEHALVVNLSDPEEAGNAAASAGGHGVDPARVPGPAISPAVTTALAAGTATGRMMQLRPDQGDVVAKGLGGRILPLSVGVKYGWAAPLGGTFTSPSPHRLKDLSGNRVLQVCMLPPTRRAHLTSLLPGLVPPTPVLRPEDDASYIIPKLSRGMNIADLAGEINRKRDEGNGYAMTGSGYAPAHMVQGGHMRVPAQYGGGQGQGQGAHSHPLAAMAGGQAQGAGQRMLLAGMGIKVGAGGPGPGQYPAHAPIPPAPPAWQQQQGMGMGMGMGMVVGQGMQYAPPPPRPFSFRPGGSAPQAPYPPVPPYGQAPQGYPMAPAPHMQYPGMGPGLGAPAPMPMPMQGHMAMQGGYPAPPMQGHMGVAQGYPMQPSHGGGYAGGGGQQAAPNWAAHLQQQGYGQGQGQGRPQYGQQGGYGYGR